MVHIKINKGVVLEERRMNSPHKRSPSRTALPLTKGVTTKDAGVNPEESKNARTLELATDQSIAARHLLYHPNESSLAVVSKCADGVDSVMRRFDRTGDAKSDLLKDEVLISMVTRLMADGSTGRIIGFNAELAKLVTMQKTEPKPDGYAKAVSALADSCRANMTNITSTAKKEGPEGALARQGVLAFMGDLGGLEKAETGYGAAFKGPLCDPKLVYDSYVAGLCDAQNNLSGKAVPATDEEVSHFEESFAKAREATSLKGGVLSAPSHTAGKKKERAPLSWDVYERKGLLNTGDIAEAKLQEVYPEHKKTLVDAAWPSYLVSSEVTKDVVEPVTGHVSGTFGEMAVTMNLFCGTPPASITRANPAGTAISSASADQVSSIAALAGSGLITAGFHSAVEMFQPMSTFSTQATQGALGPKAVEDILIHANALAAYATYLEANDNVSPASFEHKGYSLSDEELALSKEELSSRSSSYESAATKSVDMLALLQGEGGTIATLDVARVMANHSTSPETPMSLYSLNTRIEELGQGGHTPLLDKAREIAASPLRNENVLELAVNAAELAAKSKDLRKSETKANAVASELETKATKAEATFAEKENALQTATKNVDEAAKVGWGVGVPADKGASARASLDALEEVRKQAFREVKTAKIEATDARAEATTARAAHTSVETIALKAEKATLDAQIAVLEAEKEEIQAKLESPAVLSIEEAAATLDATEDIATTSLDLPESGSSEELAGIMAEKDTTASRKATSKFKDAMAEFRQLAAPKPVAATVEVENTLSTPKL